MKKTIVAILGVMALFAGVNASAQGKYGADSAECVKYLSYYQEYYKQQTAEAKDAALRNWRQAYKLCPPTASQNLYIHGISLMKREISRTKGAEAKAALIDTLMDIYNIRIANYPKKAVDVRNNYGTDFVHYYNGDNKKIYDKLSEIIAANGTDVKSSLVVTHFGSAVELYKADELPAETVIGNYSEDIAILKGITPKSEADGVKLADDIEVVESFFVTSKVASCDNLIAIYTPRYEADPENIELVGNIVKMMNATEDCANNSLYVNAVTSLHRLSPSFRSAYGLYKLYSSRGETDKAIEYLEEAIALPDSDDMQDGEYYSELAALYYKNKQNGKAYDAAAKAAELNSEVAGRSYLLMGSIWGGTSCGGKNEVDAKAHFWVACDLLQKAKAADPSLAADCNRLIGQFSSYFPQAADAFMYDITDGQSYSVACGGMRATTTVRTKK